MSAVWWYPRPTGDPGGDRHARSIHIGCIALTLAFALVVARSACLDGVLLVPEAIGALAAFAALVLNYVG